MTNESAREACKRWYIKNRERKIRKAKERYKANREEILSKAKSRYVAHPRVMRERSASWYSKNRDKVREYRRSAHYKSLSKAWREKNRHKERGRTLKYKHRITQQEYDLLMEKQGGVCAICGKVNNHSTRWKNVSQYLVVDHCHNTSKIRGLLCHRCNAGLGFFNDDPRTLKAAVDYLQTH